MKKIVFIFCAIFICSTSFGQLQLPQPSPKASFSQTVGLTDITIDYSSPGVKGRQIWGDLVPYDKIWRAGANAPTKFTFSKDVMINSVSVPKGSYSFFIIPGKEEWTLILNKNQSASTDEYKSEEDIARMKVKPQSIPLRERLLYIVSDFNENIANIDMEWEKVKISMPVSISTGEQARENINNTLAGTWRMYNSAARYMYDQKEYDAGLGYVNQSLALSDEWYNNWTKAQLLAAKNDYKQAYTFAQKAKLLGDKSEQFFFKSQVEQALTDWKVKAEMGGKKK